MNSVSLSGSLRENVGKKDAKALRAQGLVPCVIYGNNIEQVKFAMDARNFKKILYTPETLIIDLDINGKVYHTILQDIQYHPVTDEVLHADFLDVNEDNPITVMLPVRTEGTCPGVMRGGRLIMNLPKMKVRGYVNDLPDNIIVNVSQLQMNQAIKVKDLNLQKMTVLEIPKPFPERTDDEFLKGILNDQWTFDYLQKLSLDDLINLVNAANYLQIDGLINIIAAKLAHEMCNCEVEEARKKFGIECDMTEEEIAEIDKYPLD